MDKLNINFKNLLPHVIDAFTAIYGEEYRDIIKKRINNNLIIYYYDIEGLNDYISYIKTCKRREYSIKFLNKIGIDVKNYIKDNYTEPLPDHIEKILEYYIGSSQTGFSNSADYFSPLKAFKQNNDNNKYKILENKIKIINCLLDCNHEPITAENFSNFIKTNEYLRILNKINKLCIIYEELLSEYRKWEIQLQPYEKYVLDEQERKVEILNKKKKEMFKEIIHQLPLIVKSAILDKTIDQQCESIFGGTDISCKSLIEAFETDRMEKLKSNYTDYFEKYGIIHFQTNYLKNLGITIPNLESILRSENIPNYLNFLNEDKIKDYIPSEDLISYIKSVREKKYEEAIREYYTTRKDFADVMAIFDNDSTNADFIYDCLKNKSVCVIEAIKDDNEFMTIMFYTIREYDGGNLIQSFMHENCHIIDYTPKGCGFENFCNLNEKIIENSYDKKFRKYEKFNETLTDIFTMEASDYLQKKGIYLIESKEFTSLDVSNNNTASIVKQLLKPLLEKFRKQVIKAKINSNPDELIKYIGNDNFEELVDAVNKVDYLARNGVASKIYTCPYDYMVIEYFEQVERVKKIYINIDNYYENDIENPYEPIRKIR